MNSEGFVSIERPDGEVFEFGVEYFETAIEGAGIFKQDIYTEARGNGYGDIVVGSRVPAREITINSDTMITDSGDLREAVDRFFNAPEALHKITIYYKKSARWINGYIEVYDLPLDYVNDPQHFNLTMLCTDPLFHGVDDAYNAYIVATTPHFGFPVYNPMPMSKRGETGPDFAAHLNPYVFAGTVFGIYDDEPHSFLDNDGDFITYPVITITASDNVTGLRVFTPTNGIQLDTTIRTHDVIVIDNANETITRNGTNISNLMTRDSAFFGIPKGGTMLTYSAEAGATAARVLVSYDRLYKAV